MSDREEAQPPSGGARRRRLRLLALTLSALLTCAAAEGVLRAAAPQPTFARLAPGSPRCYRRSDVAPRELLPNARARLARPEFEHPIRINGQGLRMDREVAAEAPAGTKRVLVIGDSFTFGHGVAAEEAYPQRLEALLDGAEVLNLGFALGYSPDAYYAGLRKHGARFGGDVLVVGLFVGNDLTAGIENRWAEVDGAGLPTRVEAKYTRVDAEGRARPIDTLLRYRAPVLRDSHLFIGLARLTGGSEPLAATYRAALQAMHTPELYEPGWSASLRGLVDQQLKCVRGLAALAEERSLRFLVVLIPHARQVYHLEVQGEGPARTLTRTLRAEPGLAVPQRYVREALPGVAVLDLLPRFVAARDLTLYYERDGHWTAAGHARAAAWLAAELERLGWLKD